MVSFVQAGTGAVTRTVQDKAQREYIDIHEVTVQRDEMRKAIMLAPREVVAQAVAYDGFAVLGAPTQTALAAAMFPKRDASYSVVVDVEWREAKAP
jgi:hypothetical protein